jgi:hypothetical protein
MIILFNARNDRQDFAQFDVQSDKLKFVGRHFTFHS